MKRLTGWVFVYNEHTGNWQTAKREDYALLHNDVENEKVLKSKSLDTLIEIIRKTQGNNIKIKNLVK